MHIAVGIVGYRNKADIARCLEALSASTHADFEVIICENGGPDAYADLVAETPASLAGGQAVRIVLAPGNLGYGGGVNVCLQQSPDADAWWVLNPDTEPHADAMAIQADRLSAGDCDAVGCSLYLPNGQIQSHGGRWQAWIARAVSIGHGSSLDSRPDAALIERQQNYLNGASMMVSRRFLEIAGPMREEYFLYCEEVEWCLRALARGVKLGFAPGALVLHHQGTTTGNASDIRSKSRGPTYLMARNGLLLTRDVFPFRFAVVLATSFVMLFLRYARRGAWRQFGYGLQGWGAGLVGERGAPQQLGN
jgi:N-acetylglucosaminyl-diphospho-decaprenol L-rhamnosyltransferase